MRYGLLALVTVAALDASVDLSVDVRPPAVAGQFYPGSPATLRRAVETLLADARPPEGRPPVALIVPHAAYVYSGQIAADAFSQARTGDYEVVVVLGANHTQAGFDGVAIHPGTAFRTPLGDIPLDRALARQFCRAAPDCRENASVHAREHSVEVQLPFIQVLFPRAVLVPIVVGSRDPEYCASTGRALAAALRGRRALVVASSDLSHYPKANDAQASDGEVLKAFASLDVGRASATAGAQVARHIPGLATAACGLAPSMVAMSAARELGGLDARVISYAHAGDVAIGDRGRVVGYGAVAFRPGASRVDVSVLTPAAAASRSSSAATATPIDEEGRRWLLAVARHTLSRYLTTETLPLVRDAPPGVAVREQGAFVTLRKNGALRGCMGNLEGDRPLPLMVSRLALVAALEDSRFPQVEPRELEQIAIEVSLLSPMRSQPTPSAIVPGRDGVVLRKGSRSAVFLPQVGPEQGWDREALLDNLCRKAGLDLDCWKRGASLSVFTAEVFAERERR